MTDLTISNVNDPYLFLAFWATSALVFTAENCTFPDTYTCRERGMKTCHLFTMLHSTRCFWKTLRW